MRIAAIVRDAIEAGEHAPGAAVPSITVLSQRHGHARQTCAKALAVLVKEGLLRRYPGLGYYVAARPEAAGVPVRESGSGPHQATAPMRSASSAASLRSAAVPPASISTVIARA